MIEMDRESDLLAKSCDAGDRILLDSARRPVHAVRGDAYVHVEEPGRRRR